LTLGNTLVADLVPSINSGIPCMYNLINKQFYYNTGKLDMELGPECGLDFFEDF